ncbi:MFS transporter [Erwinia sp. V71]|uniref:MFS transporter n=1 Tax=Erwinia sp. V71 TaxID=3369424 RepID=UPI003F63E4DE
MNAAERPGVVTTAAPPPAWGAVFSLTLGVFSLITAEFLPASLLTPMAESFAVNEGVTGQAVTITAAVALVTSLLGVSATRQIDRRRILLALSLLLVMSNLLVASAPQLSFMLAGRVLLGVAIGGFWTLSAATAMRLVPPAQVARALSLIYSGGSLATIAAAPLGSYFGELMGWRNVFLVASAFGAVTLIWQMVTLPAMSPEVSGRPAATLRLLQRRSIQLAMGAVLLVFAGHFAFFTYLRPFLEQVAGAGPQQLSVVLLAFGVANVVGTMLAGMLLTRHLQRILLLMPLVMGMLGIGLVLLGSSLVTDTLLIGLWGMAFGAVPVGWSTWVTRTMPDDAESGGGLLVAAVQLAITLGAALGGVIFTLGGVTPVFLASALILLLAVLVIFAALRPQAEPASRQDAQKSLY